MKSIKPWYKKVSLHVSPMGTKVLLDNQPIKLPIGNSPMVLPTEGLGVLMAGEWSQLDRLKADSIPITSILSRGLQGLDQVETRCDVKDKLLKYLNTDSICYHQSYPDSFVHLQEKYWKTLLDWYNHELNLRIQSTNGMKSVQQSSSTFQFFHDYISQLDPIALACLEKAVISTKSILIPYALFQNRISVEFAAMASRLEVEHQISKWGEVQDSHDTDREVLKRDLGCISTILLLLK